MSRPQVLGYAIGGAAIGILPAIPAALLKALHASGDGSRDISGAQLLWALISAGATVVFVCAAIGAGIGMLVTVSRPAGPSEPPKQGQPRPLLIVSGAVITALLLLASPRLVILPGIGVAAVWLVARWFGRPVPGWVLLLGGFAGAFVQISHAAHGNPVAMLNYFFVWGPLGIISAILLTTVQALGPTLLLLGLGSQRR